MSVDNVTRLGGARARIDREIAADTEAPPVNAYAAEESHLATIEVCAGELPRIVDEAQAALIATDAGIYQRGGQLVRITRLEDAARLHGVARRAGSTVIVPATKDYLLLAMARAASWVQYDGRTKTQRRTNPPPAVAAALLAMSGEWKFPVLIGITAAPTLRPDGSLIGSSGFDAPSGLFGDFRDDEFPPMPTAPSQGDAFDALDVLRNVLEEFEFSGGLNGTSAVAAIAAIVTACVRHALPTAPGFGLNAHKAGSGKTTLGHTIARISTGHDAAVMPFAGEENEVRKALLAVLMAADMIVLIDNISAPIDSAAICAALTSATYKDRVLGESRTVSLPTSTTWLFNGNNLEFVGDLTSRIILSTLDPQCERPESRSFHRDLGAYVMQHRGKLIRAALTVPLAYLNAGEPAVHAAPSRFSAWDRFVRKPLIWLGQVDPLETQAELRSADPIRAGLLSLMNAWEGVFGKEPATVAEAIAAATRSGQSANSQLLDAIIEVAGDRNGSINNRRLGRWLMRHVRRIEDGRRIEDAGEDLLTHRRRFRVLKVSGVTGVSGVSPNVRAGNGGE